MPKTSILYLTLGTVRGGVEEHVLTLLRGVNRDVFELHLAVTDTLLKALGPDIPSDVRIAPFNPDTAGWAREAARLGRYLLRERIDILHSHMFRASAFASPVGWLCHVPLVVETSHGREAWRRSWWKRSYIVDRFANRFVDRTIAVSEANARFLRDEKRIPARKVVVIRNGCDLTRFRPGEAAPPDLRSRFGIGADDPILLVPARLEPQKGHATLLESLPEVVAQYPNVRVVCLGEGRLRPALEGQSRALGVERNVRFIGFQSNISEWLALANFAVLPSLYEGLPLVAVESLAAGRTMIATAVEGTPEVVLHEKTGLLVPPGDPAVLASAIRRLLDRPELAAELGAAGRVWVEKQFSQECQVLSTEDLYRRALSGDRMKFVSPEVSAVSGSGLHL